MGGKSGSTRRYDARFRARLMHGGSAIAFLTAISVASPSPAQTVAALRGAANIAQAAMPVTRPNTPGSATYPGMSVAQVRAAQYQARAAQGIELAAQAQAAARAAAAALANGVPNGLGVGGLDPVDHPQSAADDPNGLNTWDGAKGPTQVKNADGTVDVTVEQTQQRAVLDWDTFNVGSKTTLTFDQKANGVAQPDWVVLNRVVGQIDPATGLRNSALAPAPSQILGSIKADGTVLVLNQNGVLFGGSSQINVHSLVATSLEVGRAFDVNTQKALSIKDRNEEFLDFGLLAYADQAPGDQKLGAYTFSAQQIDQGTLDPTLEGAITVQAGAEIQSADSGFILLTGPKVYNSGHLVSQDGEVALESGRQITLTRSEGRSDSADPNVRGFLVTSLARPDVVGDYVKNTGLIEAERGYISMGATSTGAVIQDGVLHATTSVSRNGFVRLTGGDIQLSHDSTISIEADTGKETIPQDPTSLDAFKYSRIEIGDEASRIEIGANSMMYAPAADIVIGAAPGENADPTLHPGTSRVFIDSGAVIDAAGLTDVLIPASRNMILIRPVKKNELRDTPNYKDGFLNGVGVYVDPRISGVRDDGVAWIGSPLIEAESYYQQVGVTAAELMTRGGNVTLGTSSTVTGAAGPASTVIVKPNAVIDVSGGWVKYEAGMVQTTRLISASGQVVDIADADPNETYVGVYGGFTSVHSRWGVTETWSSPIQSGVHMEGSYTEGRDAGSLTIKSSAAALDGTVYANAFPGARQIHDAQVGTGKTSVFGDERHVQGAPSQLPVGGMLFIQALATTAGGTNINGGGDIKIVDENNYPTLDEGAGYGQSVFVDKNGSLYTPPPVDMTLSQSRLNTIFLSDQALSDMGLGQLSLRTSGAITEAAGADLTLSPGGVFDALAGRTITIDGAIAAASGDIRLQTVDTGMSSVFNPTNAHVGSYDIVVNGTLSTRGQWVNDFGKTLDQIQGSAYTNGGSISIVSAARVSKIGTNASVAGTETGEEASVNIDLSGSILINQGAVIDVSGGGRVDVDGKLDLSARGGDVSLINDTNYFQVGAGANQLGGIAGWRVNGIVDNNGKPVVAVNPKEMTSRVQIDGTILAAGFNGGGTFTLDTPEFSLGGDGPGTSLALDFFSKTGFGAYDITSYKTAFFQNRFNNGLGGYNTALQFQTLTIGAGETLNLMQSNFSQVLSDQQAMNLRRLGTGGDLYSLMRPTVAADAWDQRAISLTLGGGLELHVDEGGSIVGAASGQLTVSKLFNEGTIRIAGGTIRQAEVLPQIYGADSAIGAHSLSDVFGFRPGKKIDEDAASVIDPTRTNGEVAASTPIYFLGELGADEGVRLSADSVTDLSGTAIVNPRARVVAHGVVLPTHDGRVIDGGSLITSPDHLTSDRLFHAGFGGRSPYDNITVLGAQVGQTLNAQPTSVIDVSGASAVFDRPVAGGYAPTEVWSNGGAVMIGAGGYIIGADIRADGGAEQALGGTLVMLDPRLSQDSTHVGLNAVSADLIETAGFSTFEALGSITSIGDVDLKLDRAFFLMSRPVDDLASLGSQAGRDALAPIIGATGVMQIEAPYIRFDSAVQSISTPFVGDVHRNTAIFKADTIDISGAVLFDRSISDVQLIASGDLRLTGVQPYQHVFQTGDQTVANSLIGALAVNGNLDITAGQVYPTTGSTFTITSSRSDGTITFARSGEDTPDTPYSAGGNLTVQAANIVQGGVIRVPLGKLTLGGDNALTRGTGADAVAFAPITRSLELTDGSVTSVSAEGLRIPYGTTTDGIEWFFSPTSSEELTAPPAGELHMGGMNVALNSGAKVDLSGGGDLYAYEFISGTGGSRDVLDRFNNDPFSSHTGFQYPDGRQVYAIVPGLSDATVAPFDPIYSSDYSNLYGAGAAGQRVYLSGTPGLPAGWYTLLPAKYATLPGGFRVVEDTGAGNGVLGVTNQLKDGTFMVSGYYGVAGTDSRESTIRTFSVQSQAVYSKYSTIALTFANETFAALAAKKGEVAPRLPNDAGRLVLDPTKALSIDASFVTTPGEGGRGMQADISGSSFQIVASASQVGLDKNAIILTADSLTNLNAASLLIGGERTDNADGTTSLDVTAHSISVVNDADHPLSGPETVLVVDGSGSGIDIADGAVISAAGAVDPRSGDYIIDAKNSDMTGAGAIVRVASGPERLVERLNVEAVTDQAAVSIGAATLDGASVLLSSSGDLTASDEADIRARSLALGAGKVSFTDDPTGLAGLVVTPALEALFAKASHLTIQTPQAIDFRGGTYNFGDLTLDTPGFGLIDGDAVTLSAHNLTLANSSADLGACDGASTAACGSGALTIKANEIAFGSGVLRGYGFGASVTMSATTGVFAQGKGGFDAGPAAFAIQAPFIGDRAVELLPGEEALIPALALTTTGQLSISNPAGAEAGDIEATPGGSIALSGDNVVISGTTVRATAGELDVTSAHGLTVADGAVLETPGYSKLFGDSADPYTLSAPGGLLHLTALDGNIDLQDGSKLSVGGGMGRAGTLAFSATKGEVSFGGVLDTEAPDAGGSFVLDIGGGFDLDAFEAGLAQNFTGSIDIHTRSGNLTLSDGHDLRAENVYLTADGGVVDIGGLIDVSGVSGGEVGLYGIGGVTLESTARIDAHADGYADDDSRRAHGGVVQIGTDGAGAINVLAGALIDVSARRTGERLVPMVRNGTTYYSYVAADQGGVVAFRAPIIGDSTNATVNLSYAGQIQGASSIVLEAFKHFDLGQIAADPNFVGVSVNADGQLVLDVGATGTGGQLNWLGDNGPGTLVDFVQNFALAESMNGQLGGLADSAVFHKRPGMELDFGGDVVLNSNWNLGAGALNLAQAVVDQQAPGAEQLVGVIAATADTPEQYYILPGKEAEVFSKYGSLTYRTDGAVDGEPGVLTIRAGGDLDIKGSLTDGFFQFHDQNDPNYLNVAMGGGNPIYLASLSTGCGDCASVGDWQPGDPTGLSLVSINFPGATSLSATLFNPAPYNAAANTPSAQGSLPGGAGDPLASAELFPLLTSDRGGGHVDSWSYRLVGGADLIAAGGAASADPLRTLAGADGSVIVEGTRTYQFKASAGTTGSSFDDGALFMRAGAQSVSADQWLAAFLAANPGLGEDAYTFINFANAPASVQALLISEASDFFAGHADQSQFIGPDGAPTGVTTTIALAAQFMSQLLTGDDSHAADIIHGYSAPRPVLDKNLINGFSTTLVRTGSGSINLAAAADIDLRNGADPTYRDLNGDLVAAGSGYQMGGAAVYTAGYLADLTPRVVTDALTGLTRTIDASAYEISSSALSGTAFPAYRYGADLDPQSSGYLNVYVANPVYAEGGGEVSLVAGRDVLSRRDLWDEARVARFQLGTYSVYNWMGTADQLWRTGSIGTVTNVRINPQLFSEGVGALGGGDITVRAGRDVVDLSVVADTSVTTADVLGGANLTQALWTFGRGDISLTAGRDLLGGRLDIGSGSAEVEVGGDVVSAGQVLADLGSGRMADNQLLIRLSDATVDLQARGLVDIQGVRSLGVAQPPSALYYNTTLNAFGFYSSHAGLSILADGAVTVENRNGVLQDSQGGDLLPLGTDATRSTVSAIYPGTFEASSLTGDLDVVTVTTGSPNIASAVIMAPSAAGELRLFSGADIAPLTIAMEDGDPGLLPGAFSDFQVSSTGVLLSGRGWSFPGVLPSTSDTERRALHNATPTHEGDEEPNRIYAYGDIRNMIISTPKQTRIGAGRDIINMMFFGQNLTSEDITRIVAGRDITATTHLVRPLIESGGASGDVFGALLPALDGNAFVIGGPGAFFLEAGRDAGPFLNSATTGGFLNGVGGRTALDPQSYAGGIISVGNEWNPWLGEKGSDLYVMFGVGKGADYDGFRDYYLDPANLANLDGDLFAQNKDESGNLIPDRSRPIYGPVLVKWMQEHAAAQLQAAYGRTEVSYQEAYDAFKALPELRQRIFILDNVYFNELTQTSVPDGPSFQQYSRGYLAVNTLFPASLGYTANDLTGGGNGANELVHTGDLDLRLASIETSRGGDIYLLGPGGRVLAGSTVRTSEQAARRAYDGGRLFLGNVFVAPVASAIDSIPIGFEGVLTLRGGSINSFTDGDFLLNQSRLFTEAGGDVAMWSSNGDLNAGQGPKTSANFPPVAVKLDEDLFSQLDSASSVSGAGIAAFQPAPGVEAPDVFLIAPRGTVDAGDAGVRVAGNLFIAALQVANANNFAVGGTSFGIPTGAAVDVGAQTSAGAATAAAAQAAEAATASGKNENEESVISANVVGYAGGEGEDDKCRKDKDGKTPAGCPTAN